MLPECLQITVQHAANYIDLAVYGLILGAQHVLDVLLIIQTKVTGISSNLQLS